MPELRRDPPPPSRVLVTEALAGEGANGGTDETAEVANEAEEKAGMQKGTVGVEGTDETAEVEEKRKEAKPVPPPIAVSPRSPSSAPDGAKSPSEEEFLLEVGPVPPPSVIRHTVAYSAHAPSA